MKIICVAGLFSPGTSTKVPGDEAAVLPDLGTAFWPGMILVLLLLFIILDLADSWKSKRGQKDDSLGLPDLGRFIKSRRFVGMVLIGVMVILLPVLGFLPDCFCFLTAYGYLLGERRWGWLILRSFLVTIILYVVFQGVLNLPLPDGAGLFFQFSQFWEKLLFFT